MKCDFCGAEFDEREAAHACRSCSMFGTGCHKVKCPQCGYETPAEPGFVRKVRRWWRKFRERQE